MLVDLEQVLSEQDMEHVAFIQAGIMYSGL